MDPGFQVATARSRSCSASASKYSATTSRAVSVWAVAIAAAYSAGCGRSAVAGEQRLEQRLLGVQTVLRLIPDGGALAVENVLGDLLAGVGGEAMQHDRPVGSFREQVGVEPVGLERAAPRVGVLVAHAHPDVGVDRIGAGDGLARVAGVQRRQARL